MSKPSDDELRERACAATGVSYKTHMKLEPCRAGTQGAEDYEKTERVLAALTRVRDETAVEVKTLREALKEIEEHSFLYESDARLMQQIAERARAAREVKP